MPTDYILSLLIAERDKLNAAIAALQGPTKRRGRPPAAAAVPTEAAAPATQKTRKKRNFSPEQREAARLRMKAMWKKRKAAKKAA